MAVPKPNARVTDRHLLPEPAGNSCQQNDRQIVDGDIDQARYTHLEDLGEQLPFQGHAAEHQAAISPDIDLRVLADERQIDFAQEDADVAIRHGDGNWPGLDAVRLCSEQLLPVCSPNLVSGSDRIAKECDLLRFPLLRLHDWATWTRWFEAAGVTDPIAHGPLLNRASMLIDAAIDGQGIALARTVLAARDIIHGRLIRPVDVSLPLSSGGRRAPPYLISANAPSSPPAALPSGTWPAASGRRLP